MNRLDGECDDARHMRWWMTLCAIVRFTFGASLFLVAFTLVFWPVHALLIALNELTFNRLSLSGWLAGAIGLCETDLEWAVAIVAATWFVQLCQRLWKQMEL